MDRTRKPFQGVINIVRFNWPFYILTSLAIIGPLIAARLAHGRFQELLLITAVVFFLPVLISLLASLYIYDLSGLYHLAWLDDVAFHTPGHFINVNAGFDETSLLLQQKYPAAALKAFDFYDAAKHTEPSIRRARQAYMPYPGTQAITTGCIPCEDNSVDAAFVLFTAHEIRDDAERALFFKELRRTLKPAGCIIVAEHLRDVPNFIAYNIGFLHFLPRAGWLKTFRRAGLQIKVEKKHTPFVTLFILSNHAGDPS